MGRKLKFDVRKNAERKRQGAGGKKIGRPRNQLRAVLQVHT